MKRTIGELLCQLNDAVETARDLAAAEAMRARLDDIRRTALHARDMRDARMERAIYHLRSALARFDAAGRDEVAQAVGPVIEAARKILAAGD